MPDGCRAQNCKAKHPHKRFCVHGHDTFVVGRWGHSDCCECKREYQQSEKYREYRQSEKYREYRQSEKYRACHRVLNRRYAASPRAALRQQIRRNEKSLRELEARYIELVGGLDG